MGSHKYGRYLHILTPAGANGVHDGPQPWEGITGRVKQLVKQETNIMMSVIKQSNAANQKAIKGVEAKLEAQQSKLESQLRGIEGMLSTLLDQRK